MKKVKITVLKKTLDAELAQDHLAILHHIVIQPAGLGHRLAKRAQLRIRPDYL